MMRILVPFGPLSPEKSLPVFPFFQTVTFLFVEEFLLQNLWYYPKLITTYLSVLLLHTSSHPSNLQLTNLFGNPKPTHLSAQQTHTTTSPFSPQILERDWSIIDFDEISVKSNKLGVNAGVLTYKSGHHDC